MAADVNGTFYYFGYDALGSQVAVLNATGSLVGAQLYGPYGASRYNTGAIPTSIGFTGQQADSVTGLDYYVARYYDELVGVFLSADSVQGNMQGMELYTYVMGNPETGTDPTGHCWPVCTIIAGAIAGVIAAEVSGLITGQQPSLSDLAWAAAGTATGIWRAGASSLLIGGTTWGGVTGAAVAGGLITGWAAGGVQVVKNALSNVVNPTPVEAPGVKSTPIPISVPAQTSALPSIKSRDTSSLVMARVQKASKTAPRRTTAPKRTYTHTSTHSYNSWTRTSSGYNSYTQSNYSYSDTVYHYANPSYNYSVFSSSNGYYQRSSGGMRMS